MRFEVSPKGRDYSLKISGVGYQTLSKSEVLNTIEILNDRLNISDNLPAPIALDEPLTLTFGGLMLKFRSIRQLENFNRELKEAITQTNEPEEVFVDSDENEFEMKAELGEEE